MLDELSIITPTYNNISTIAATLASISPLVKNGAEHIVVDSGSTDGTNDLCKQSGARVLFHEKGNLYAAINLGVSVSGRKWITYINADDLLYASTILSGIEKHGDVSDVIYGNIDYIDEAGRFIHCYRNATPNLLRVLYCSGLNAVPQQGAIFKRDLFHKLKGFDTSLRLVADMDFFYRAINCNATFSHVRFSPVAAFRLHKKQLSQVFQEELLHEVENVLLHNNTTKASLLLQFVARNMLRLSNLDNYIVRILRHKQITGRYTIPRTITIPEANTENI